MKIKENQAIGLISILIGTLFVVMKQGVITTAMCVVGIIFIVWSIVDFLEKIYPFGIVKLVLGISLIIFGSTLLSVALYIISALFVIFGFLQIVGIKRLAEGCSAPMKALIYSKPVLYLLAGICLLFNQGKSVSWIFVMSGILLIFSGMVNLIQKQK